MFKSFEQFKSVTKVVYDALRSNPSMKLSAFRQLVCSEAGFLNPQSVKAYYGEEKTSDPEILIGDQLTELFNTSYVVDDLGAPKELYVNGDDTIVISSSDEDARELGCQLDEAKGELYDGVLMLYVGTEYIGKYTVYKRHQQPIKTTNEAFIVFVNSESDMGFYLNGKTLGYVDRSAGDDFEPIVKAVLGVMQALDCSVEMVGIDLDDDEWNWDMVPPLLSSKEGVTPLETIDSESHWFFNRYA